MQLSLPDIRDMWMCRQEEVDAGAVEADSTAVQVPAAEALPAAGPNVISALMAGPVEFEQAR